MTELICSIVNQTKGEIFYGTELQGFIAWQKIAGEPKSAILENEYEDIPLVVFSGYHDREPEYIEAFLNLLIAHLADAKYEYLTIPVAIYTLHKKIFEGLGAKTCANDYSIEICQSHQIQSP